MFNYIFLIINIIYPIKFNNYDNFNQIIIFKTPTHIEPEWYFIFFYAILRSNKNKLIGLIIILLSIIIWFIIPKLNKTKFIYNKYFIINKIIIFRFILIIILITFLGTKTSKEPYIILIKKIINLYFLIFINMYFIILLINNN